MENQENQALRYLPSVDAVLKSSELQSAIHDFDPEIVTKIVREAKDKIRAKMLKGGYQDADKGIVFREMLSRTLKALELLKRPFYQKVINATGIILHTALGRAVLAPEALTEIQEELAGYSRLQIGLGSGQRSRRDEGVERLLQRLTGAQAATVVNNNAAATAIVLNTIAKGKEVIVSRGQLVEIGGEFRLPDVMAFSGARMVEVGTTNKTHARDYERAITDSRSIKCEELSGRPARLPIFFGNIQFALHKAGIRTNTNTGLPDTHCFRIRWKQGCPEFH